MHPPCEAGCTPDLTAQLDRLEALLLRLLPPEPVPPASLLAALEKATGRAVFTSGEVWATAREEAEAAQALGGAVPDLWAALRRARIGSARALGQWLGAQPEVQRGGLERGGRQWHLR